ncbi:hypothetical protein BGZ75_009955 [Mortierella antarctica]|nr:hypothetical protein BGZ75_009955 [Mortierella antarctica]
MNEDTEKDMEDRTEENMVEGTEENMKEGMEEGADEGTNEDMEEETDQSADEGTNEEQETSRASDRAASPERPSKPTIPTLELSAAEDRPDCIDLSQLAGDNVVLGFGGTDCPGNNVSHHCAVSWRGGSHATVMSFPHSVRYQYKGSQGQGNKVATGITARQIDSISHSHRNAKAMEKLLKGDGCKLVRDALASISTIGSLDRARTTSDLDQAMKARRAARDTLQALESTKARNKQLHTQSLRTQRAYATLCENERKYVQEHSAKDEPSKASPDDGWCPNCAKHHIPPNTRSAHFATSDAAHGRPRESSPYSA